MSNQRVRRKERRDYLRQLHTERDRRRQAETTVRELEEELDRIEKETGVIFYEFATKCLAAIKDPVPDPKVIEDLEEFIREFNEKREREKAE